MAEGGGAIMVMRGKRTATVLHVYFGWWTDIVLGISRPARRHYPVWSVDPTGVSLNSTAKTGHRRTGPAGDGDVVHRQLHGWRS